MKGSDLQWKKREVILLSRVNVQVVIVQRYLLVGAGSRPLIRGVGPLAAGLGMLACAALIVAHWPESSDDSVGLWVGLP